MIERSSSAEIDFDVFSQQETFVKDFHYDINTIFYFEKFNHQITFRLSTKLYVLKWRTTILSSGIDLITYHCKQGTYVITIIIPFINWRMYAVVPVIGLTQKIVAVTFLNRFMVRIVNMVPRIWMNAKNIKTW